MVCTNFYVIELYQWFPTCELRNSGRGSGVTGIWNVMAHAQKPDFVFRRNGRIHLNRWGRQFSRMLAAEVCVSAVVMLDRPRSEVAWEYWLPTPFASFLFTFPAPASPCAIRFQTHSTATGPRIHLSNKDCHFDLLYLQQNTKYE